MPQPRLSKKTVAEMKRTLDQIRGFKPAGSKPPRALLTDWRAWFKATHASLWEGHPTSFRANMSGHTWETISYHEARKLSKAEWATIQRIIRQQNLVCSMRNACMGFNCGMTVYAEGVPVYPGVPVEPELLLDITAKHLPGEGYAVPFNEAFAILSAYTHTPENAARLARNGLETPRDKGYYDY